MPLEVVSTDGRTFRYREYVLPALGPNDVRVRVDFAAPKHGTELHSLTGSPHDHKQWDEELRLYLPRAEPLPLTERAVGNMVVGTVTEVGRMSPDSHRATASSGTDRSARNISYPKAPGGRWAGSPRPTPCVQIRRMWRWWPFGTETCESATPWRYSAWAPSG